MIDDLSGQDDLRDYELDDQIGFRLRIALQRHTAIFFAHMTQDLTQTQFAAAVRLWENGPCSQNELGRLAGIDSATIGGVVQRLQAGGYVRTEPHPSDRRRVTVALTVSGETAIEKAIRHAAVSNERTLAALSPGERQQLLRLLRKISQ